MKERQDSHLATCPIFRVHLKHTIRRLRILEDAPKLPLYNGLIVKPLTQQCGMTRRRWTMARGITHLAVKRLFGRYDYTIDLAKGETTAPQISLLYGENGTGKTTILELAFHILSSDTNRGHKSFVSNTPFQRFSISFSDGLQVAASRSHEVLVGSFDLELVSPEGHFESSRISIDPQSTRRDGWTYVTSRSNSQEAKVLLEKISELNLTVLYLGDSRDLEGDTIASGERRRFRRPRTFSRAVEEDWYDIEGDELEEGESTLVESIHRTEQHLYLEAIRSSMLGETDARESHASILRTIAHANTPTGGELRVEVERLKGELKDLEITGKDFSIFGLSSAIDAQSLSESLDSANEMTLPVVVQVLGSFLEGQRVRLECSWDALRKGE